MNLHITHDNVFLDYIIGAVEALNENSKNRFCVYLYPHEEKPVKIKSKRIEYAHFHTPDFYNLIGDWGKYERVYLHWMYGFPDNLALKIPKHIKVIWCFWGGDGLESDSLLSWVYQKKSFDLFKKLNKKEYRFSFSEMKKLYRKRKADKLQLDIHRKAVQRVDYFAHYIPQDYQLVKGAFKTNMKFVDFFYAPCDEMAGSVDKIKSNRQNILLGNSDTITNNHLEAIDILKKIPLGNRKVICPLSYEKGKYAAIINQYGKEHLKTNFQPILNFMPLNEYNDLLADVGFAVMNHNRSQALGNIYTLLFSGVKLFMSKDSTLYQYFKEKGFIVFNIQDELVEGNLVELSITEQEHNKSLLLKCFGKTQHLDVIRKLLVV